MKRALAVAWCASLLFAFPPSAALAKAVVDVHARGIDFFANRLSLVARGGVDVRFPDGVRAHADSLYADLRRDVFVLAGSVHAVAHGARLDAAAMSLDLDKNRLYAVELDGVAVTRSISPSDLQGEVTAPPDGTFDFPDLAGVRPYIRSRHAAIVPHSNVRFVPALFPTSVGITGPSPMYVYWYNANPNFGATTLPPANFDQPLVLDGSETALTSAHLRYIAGLGFSLGLDQHYVYGERGFLVGSISSLASKDALYSVLAYERIAPKLTQQFSATVGPYNTESYQITQGFKWSSFSIATANFTTSTTLDMTWKTYNRPLPYGFTTYVLADFGFDQNSLGLYSTTEDPVKYDLIWRKTVQAYLASPLFRLPAKVTANATVTAGRTWYAYPHRRDAVTLTSTASRRLNRQFNAVFNYVGNFNSDSYINKQLLFYPQPALPYYAPDGTPWPGFLAYSGATSYRSYELDTYYTTGPALSARLSYARTDDFPQFHGYGRPQYGLGGDVRVRLGSNLSVDIGRSYLFNWGGQTWSPQWSLTISQ